MIRWRTLLAPTLVAAGSAWLVRVATWDGVKQGLLVALSVIAAGVLVRLARGLPFTTADHYEVDEIRLLTKAVSQIMRSLRLLIAAVMTGMVALVLAKPALDLAASYEAVVPHLPSLDQAISGFIGLDLAYVFVRMFQAVRGDQDLTELQSKFIVRAVERKQGKRFEEQQAKANAEPFRAPKDYGQIVN